MLPQRLFSLSRHLVLKKVAVLTERTPRFFARMPFLLKAHGSFGESLAAFSGVVLLHGYRLFSATACQRRFCAFKICRDARISLSVLALGMIAISMIFATNVIIGNRPSLTLSYQVSSKIVRYLNTIHFFIFR